MNPTDFFNRINLQEVLIFLSITIFVIGAFAVGVKSLSLAFQYWWVALPLFGAWFGGALGFLGGVAVIIVLKLLFFLIKLPFKLLASKDGKNRDSKIKSEFD